jgi:type I restriction enzyme S subunit
MTGGQTKIPKGDYLESGDIPIIDQGQDLIGGYTNERQAVCDIRLPCVVFGDHTKIFKFVTKPFALGADGVKVLSEANNIDPKFAYYFLNTLNLPNVGYSRHFRFLKRTFFPLPPLEEQRRIAAILDKADGVRRKRKEAIRLTEELLKSTFLEMFGDPVTNPKGWEVIGLGKISQIQGGLQVTPARKELPLEVPYLRVANVYRDKLLLDEIKNIRVTSSELERINMKAGDILIVEGHGNKEEIGRSSVWDGSIENCVHQNHLIRVRLDPNKAEPIYISAYLNSAGGRCQLTKFGKTTSGLNTISTSNVKATKVLCPPIEMQKRYLDFQRKLTEAKNASVQHLEQSENLFNSLLQRAFRGEL